jgi:hypothetical protein
MAYDRADWHYGGTFPKGLPDAAGGTHIGMFLAWAIMRGLEGEDAQADTDSLEAVRARRMTGRDYLLNICDEKFWESDLSEEGNAFAKQYYGEKGYYKDYEKALARRLPSLYHVEDSWDNFDRLTPVLDQRFRDWKSGKPLAAAAKQWWKIW